MSHVEKLKALSKFLSYVLRHHPEAIGLSLDRNGWAHIDELMARARKEGREISRPLLYKVIDSGDKQRFILSDDEQYIRAGYGHSIEVDLQLQPKPPPRELYHGTTRQQMPSIVEKGLLPGNRNFVHLSADRTDARKVGSRHGKPIVLSVNCGAMTDQGFDFYQSKSEPGIWLIKYVPARFLHNEAFS